MKLVSYRIDGIDGYGRLDGDRIVPATILFPTYPTLRAVLEAGALDELAALGSDTVLALSDVTLLPVVPDPGKIICVGINYREHRDETGHHAVGKPTLFIRFADSQAAAGVDVLRPAGVSQFDYEGEVALVIGTGGRDIARADALDHVAGYACYNDFTARDWQGHSSQWTPGKNFPGTGAFGPCLVTADEIGDVASLQIETRVNGEVRQSAPLTDLLFDVPDLIGYISQFTPLSPGDVIVTGTPGGAGMFRQPPIFLEPGDLVEVEVAGLGLLANAVG